MESPKQDLVQSKQIIFQILRDVGKDFKVGPGYELSNIILLAAVII